MLWRLQTSSINSKANAQSNEAAISDKVKKTGDSMLVYIQNDEVGFNSAQVDSYQQRVEDRVTALNHRLFTLLERDRVYDRQREQQRRWKKNKLLKAKNSENSSFWSLDADERYLVYSAHYDAIQSTVKLVGFGPINDEQTILSSLSCKIEDNSGNSQTTRLSVYYRISTYYPWKGQIYDSYVFACNASLASPTSVTVTSDKTKNVTLPIVDGETILKYNFAVCVEPLVNAYNDTKSIKHFIAANSVFGAEHFYFYVSDASQEVESLLASLPMVTIYQWRLGELTHKTHAYGQKASNAHCLYNHRAQADYLVYIDIDEVLVPRMHSNWSALVHQLSNEHQDLGMHLL